MQKCGKLYDEMELMNRRRLDDCYLKTLDAIRRGNIQERRRWLQKLRQEGKLEKRQKLDNISGEQHCTMWSLIRDQRITKQIKPVFPPTTLRARSQQISLLIACMQAAGETGLICFVIFLI